MPNVVVFGKNKVNSRRHKARGSLSTDLTILPMEKDPASSLVWVRDKKDVWRVAKIVSATDTEVVVEGKEGSGSQETFSGSDHAIFDQTHNLPLPDLSQYNNLHEAPLLYGLKKRFADDTIYTHCGEILGEKARSCRSLGEILFTSPLLCS